MKKTVKIFVLLILLVGLTLKGIAQKQNIRLKILTYNIYHGATMNNDFNLSKIAYVINSTKPDLVALQEVDLKTNRAKKMDLITELAKQTGLIPLFGRAMYYDDGEYGEGILSKYSFIKTHRHLLPNTDNHEPRAALEILIELPGGDIIRFIGTHLDHTEDDTNRKNQVKEINRIFIADDYPTILAGDLNAVPESKVLSNMKSLWEDACNDDNAKTFPANKPDRRIDYIMYKPVDRWKLIDYKVICDKIASDHCAVLCTFELIKK